MLVLAFSVSSILMAIEARRQGQDADKIFNLAFIAFISGIIGARLFYVVENAYYYLKFPYEIVMFHKGGLSWYGGLILGSIAAFVYIKKNKLGLYKTLDLLAPFVALAQSLGRIGCFLNGCCYGKESAFGIYFPAHEAQLIPTQIYSSLALLAIFAALRILQERPHRLGAIIFSYLFLYSIKRFFVEFWRADNDIVFYGLTLFQILSILLFVFSAIMLIYIRQKKD